MIYTYPYDSAYHGPAMPTVDITISLPDDENRKIVLRGLVDSGADATMIPVRYLRQLGAKVTNRHRVRGTDNIAYPVDVYAVLMEIGPLEKMIIPVSGNRFNGETIIGRDVLNQLIVTLNGLAHVTEISD